MDSNKHSYLELLKRNLYRRILPPIWTCINDIKQHRLMLTWVNSENRSAIQLNRCSFVQLSAWIPYLFIIDVSSRLNWKGSFWKSSSFGVPVISFHFAIILSVFFRIIFSTWFALAGFQMSVPTNRVIVTVFIIFVEFFRYDSIVCVTEHFAL